jgi:FTR1 family protein
VFEALVITLREGIEAALVVGIIVTYLDKTGRPALKRAVFLGLMAGIAASLASAWALSTLGIEEERWEGWLMLLGALFVGTMVLWMWRAARGLKRAIESRVEAIAARPSGAVAAGLFLLTFLLILREGIETVLFLATVSLTTDALLSFAGGLLGLVLAAAFGVALVRGTVRVDLPRFFKITEIVLIVLAAQLFVGGLHELGELGAIPIGREEMRLIGPIVKNDVPVLVVLLALPLLLIAVPGRRERERAAAAGRLEGPEKRLALAGLRREARWRRALAAAGVVVIASLTVSFAFTRLPQGIDPPRILTVTGASSDGAAEGPDGPQGEVRVPMAGLDDGHLHRFGVTLADGTVVRFIVLASRGKVVPAFDACVVCGAYGYVERQGRLVCLACAADINTATIGVGGGCNPIPLKYREEAGELVIAARDLVAEAPAFRGAQATVMAPPSR